MTACSDRETTLYLDIYGELPPRQATEWHRHLDTCRGCREERQRLTRLVGKVESEFSAPALTDDSARDMRSAIIDRLHPRIRLPWWRQLFSGGPRRLVPALATAAILVAVLGWFGITRMNPATSGPSLSRITTEEQMILENYELIENLELLEEMEALEKLVELVDTEDLGNRIIPTPYHEARRGAYGHTLV